MSVKHKVRVPLPLPACMLSMGCLCAGHAGGAPSSAPCDTTERPARPSHRSSLGGIARMLASAEAHGEATEPDMEVGDLQELARLLWQNMGAAQREAFARRYWDAREDWS